MKVILYKDVPNLGEEGDIKIVTNGYARNFLIPQKLAVKYTKATEIELAQKQQAIARRKAEKTKNASDLKTRIESIDMELAASAGDKGRLFGSITSAAIVDYLSAQGIEIERKKIELPDGGIKTVGNHSVRVRLYGGEEAVLKIEVKASGDKPVIAEAPEEVKIDAIGSEEDEEVDEAYAELTGGMDIDGTEQADDEDVDDGTEDDEVPEDEEG